MARDVITLRPVPAAEPCAQVGDSGYAEIAFLQCRRYIAFLRLAIGPEPDGARLRVRRSDTEFDPYIDVVIEYDTENPAASDYALRCERDAPARWRERSWTRAPPSAEDDPDAMRRSVIGERDAEVAGERDTVDLHRHHPPRHPPGVLHHDVISGGAMAEDQLEARPCARDAGIDHEPRAAQPEAENRFEPRPVHPAR